MPSPFPGMNPYLENENVWHDFHQRFAIACADALAPQGSPKYIVKVDYNIYIHEQSAEQRLAGRPDVAIISRDVNSKTVHESATSAAPAYALVSPVVDIEHQNFVEIRDRESRELVSVIELISPSNKRPGSDREQYIAKRKQYFAGNVNLIEIDLLRGFERLPYEGLPNCDYVAVVSRAEERPRVGVWPIKLREKLPTIPVPLRAPDLDASLNLQAVLDHVYDSARYTDYVYLGTPQPPLHGEDETWARLVIAKRV